MNLNDLLFLDIETVSQTASFDELDERLKKHWLKKAEFLKNDEEIPLEDLFFQRGAIYSEFGKVITIAFGFISESHGEKVLRATSISNDDEKLVLNGFAEILKTRFNESRLRLCAHNGKEFDYPYLARRMTVHGIQPPLPLQLSGKKPWEVPHFDTMEMWKHGDRKNFTSLDLLAAVFDIPSSKSDLDGSQVNDYYYNKKDLKSIDKYCRNDVVVLAQLFLKLNFLPLLAKEQIVFVETDNPQAQTRE